MGKATDNRTDAQKASLVKLLKELRCRYPNAQILGHRDISPDTNHNGKVDSWERIKECPCLWAIGCMVITIIIFSIYIIRNMANKR